MYLVTGATGNVGREIVTQLLARGENVRVFTRHPEKVAHLGNRVEAAIGDQTHPDTFARAVKGVKAVFLMNGALDGNSFRQLIAAAKANGSPRIVFLSTLFAADPQSPIGQIHKDKEDVITAAGLPRKFIRVGAFMTNVFQWLASIKSQGVVYNAMGTGKVAPVAPEDIAAVAVHALTDPHPETEILEVTGNELLTVSEQVAILSNALGKPLQTIDVTTEAAVQGLLGAGVPVSVAGAVGKSFEDIRDGKMETVSDTLRKIAGKQPRTFQSWAQEYAPRFA
jgi:uncharacterized protein YbjT (DUF2867 family)